MPSGSIEGLPSGKYRAVVRAGRDPIPKKYLKLTETCDTESQAILARERMLAQSRRRATRTGWRPSRC